MRIDLKPAAFLAAAAFGLLIIFGAAWPGVWLLALALVLVAAAAAIWLRGARTLAAYQQASSPAFSPFADAMTYGRSAMRLPRTSQTQPRALSSGIPVAALIGSIGVVALILFIGGVLGSGGNSAQDQVAHSANVDVIDRSGTDATEGSGGVGAATTQGDARAATTHSDTGDGAASTDAAAPLRPIVVKDPSGAAPVSQRASPAAQPEPSGETVGNDAPSALVEKPEPIVYIVQQGDTLWDIATRFDVPVSVLADLNTLINAEIHPGDELLVPAPEE